MPGMRMDWFGPGTALAAVGMLAVALGIVAWRLVRALRELSGRLAAAEARVEVIEGAWLARTPEARAVVAGSAVAPRSREARDAIAGVPTLIRVPDVSRPQGPAPSSRAPLDRRFRDVGALADAGQRPEAIARATGLPVGQVELILGLRRQAAPEPQRPWSEGPSR